jgi:hypothetical protein
MLRSLLRKALPGVCGAGLLLAAANPAAAALVVTGLPSGNASGTVLANNILGPGVTIVPGSVTYIGANNQSGTFTGGLSAGIGIDSGIILTSGSVNNAPGPNNSDNASTSTGTGGDAQLTALAGNTTFDKAVLEFDFTTAGGDLFFNYVFASEEYNEFANSSVNDTFAFFLDGTNIALIPGTTTPVSINTVNGGNPFGTNAQNSTFYNNNDAQDGGPFFNLQYDGFTDVFTATALGVGAGTHHIKIAIADAGDTIYDSGVFIQAGSFSDTDPSVPEPGSLALLGISALGIAGYVRRRRKVAVA